METTHKEKFDISSFILDDKSVDVLKQAVGTEEKYVLVANNQLKGPFFSPEEAEDYGNLNHYNDPKAIMAIPTFLIAYKQ